MTATPAGPPTVVPSSGGVELALHDLGGDGPPLLLCHATGFCGRVWEPVASRLAAGRAGHHAWALDFRGHGDSPLPEAMPLSWDDFADDVLAVVDRIGSPEPLVAAGHSKGGAALLLAEQAHPGTVAALYLYEPVVFPPSHDLVETGENPLAAGARRRREHFPDRAAAAANYRSKPPLDVLHPEALDAYVTHGFADDPERGGVTLKCRPEVEARTFEMGPHHRAWDHLGEVRCPVTVVRGGLDPFGPAAVAPEVATRLSDGRLVEHPDLGHFGPLQDPDAIAEELQATLG